MRCGIVVDNELNNDIRVLREIGILKEQGYEIFVLCFGFHNSYNNPVSGIQIERIRISRKLKDILFFLLNSLPVYEWLWASTIRKFISNNLIDTLHVHDLYMARAVSNGIKMSKKHIPMILDLHENYPFTVSTYNWTKGFLRNLISKPAEWKMKEREYLGFADHIIVLSNEFRDLLLNTYPDLSPELFSVLPNVPDLTVAGHKSNKQVSNPFNSGAPIIFYYGVIAERRGVFDSLEVFNQLLNDNQKINFLLIGPVDKKDRIKFSKIINREELKGRVHYIPWIDSSDLPAYLEIVDICLAPFHKNPQHESGVANKIYEYMLGKKPLIVSDCLPQQQLVEKNKCGFVFRNLTEFKDEIIELTDNKELRDTLGKNGFEAIIKEYNTGNVKQNLVSLYKTIEITN